MDCAICFEAITAQTGSTTMACTHSFHFGCLVKWFGSQADKNLHESCPCCRREANEHERLPEQDVEEDEDEDEESDDESDISDDVNATLAELHFITKRDLLSDDAFHAYAATRIQAAWRAYLPRMAWVKHKMNMEERKDTTELVKKFQKEEAALIRQEALHTLRMTSSREEWRNISAIMIQAIWRGYAAGQKAIKMALSKGYKLNWICKGAHWERTFLSHREIWRPSDGMPPQSLEFQNHRLWTKVQAVWRAYRIRKVWKEHDGKGDVQFTLPVLNAVLQHLGGKYLSHKEFRRFSVLSRKAFREVCAAAGARPPTEIEWREAARACGWIPARMQEELTRVSPAEHISTFVPRLSYSGLVAGWSLCMQYCRKKRVNPAASRIQKFWRSVTSRLTACEKVWARLGETVD